MAGGRTDFEFIELQNISNSVIDLVGTTFSQGVDFEFNLDSPVRTLEPGEQVLIVENAEAMSARYGNSIIGKIAGEFDSDSKLSNNGETITLTAASGLPIKSFVYSDEAPWPTSADGDGFSLILTDPASNPDHSLPENWQSSDQVDGSPGGILRARGYISWIADNFDPDSPVFELISAPGADPDGDTITNSMEYAFGTDPNNTDSRPEIEALVVRVDGNDYLAVRFLARANANDLGITGQISNDFTTWTASTVPFGAPDPSEDGRQRITLRSTNPIPQAAEQQIRLKIEISQ